MAQSTRLPGKYSLQTLTITPSGGSPIVIKNDVASITLNIDTETEEAHAILDNWKYPIGFEGGWSIDIESFMDADTNSSNTLATRALAAMTVNNTQVSVELMYKSPASGHTNRGDKWTGSGIVTSSNITVPSRHMTLRATIVGQGALTLAVPS